ncbi:MAG: thioredoxin family protein [Clostridia bacterium]|nr:thioredoxin family protein [Clostridia bacterium]
MITIIQYGSETCAPCRAIRQRITHWQQSHPDITYQYLPLEDHLEEAAQQGIFTVPTVLVTADGREIARESGYFSLTGILQQIERFQSLFGDSAE